MKHEAKIVTRETLYGHLFRYFTVFHFFFFRLGMVKCYETFTKHAQELK